MNKFIILTFLLLAFLFYEMSGGADFEPRQPPVDVAQSTDADDTVERTAAPTPAPLPVSDPAPALALAQPQIVAEPIAPLSDAPRQTDLDPAPVDAASVETPSTAQPQAEQTDSETPAIDLANLFPLTGSDEDGVNPDAVQITNETTFNISPLNTFQPTAAEPVAAVATPPQTEQAQPQLDIREITGSRVNMRAGPGTEFTVLSRLTIGDEVEILSDPGDGWVRLRPVNGGEIGWIADFLVSDP